MAKRLTIEMCLSEEPHDAHEFRPAIFGIGRKVRCTGIKAPEPKPHKHNFKLHMYPTYPFINPDKVVGHCSCGVWSSIDKEGFYDILRGDMDWYRLDGEELDPVR